MSYDHFRHQKCFQLPQMCKALNAISDYPIIWGMRDFLNSNFIICGTDQGLQKRGFTPASAQGSVLEHFLWWASASGNIKGIFLIEYAEKIAMIFIARHIVVVQMILKQAMRWILSWMEWPQKELAAHITEIGLLTKKQLTTRFSYLSRKWSDHDIIKILATVQSWINYV